jgi:hypothetical protein
MEKEKLLIKLKRPSEEEKENVPLKKIKLNISQLLQKEFSLEEFMGKLIKEFPSIAESVRELKNLKNVRQVFTNLDKLAEFEEFTRKNVPIASDDKITKLYHGIGTRDVKSVEKIIKCFPLVIENMSICTLFGSKFTWNCLHAACYYGLEKVTRLILEMGGDVEVKDTLNQARPLGWAAYGGHAELCKLLVSEYNADPWAKNIHGQNAFSLVADQSHPRWAGIWSKKDERREKKKVLLTIPTIQKKEEDGEDLYVTVQPRKNQSRSEVAPTPSPRVPPRQQAPVLNTSYPISYGEFSLELIPLIKSLGIVSDDERIKMVYQVEPTFFGTVITVPAKVQSLSLRLNLISLPEHKLYSSGYLYTSRLDIVKFKGSKSGAFQDTQLNLSEGVNVFEIRTIGGVVDESEVGKSRSYLEFLPGTEKGQSFLLIVNRS